MLAALAAEAESKCVDLAVEAAALYLKDLIAGKNPVQAAIDLAETLAEKQAAALRDVVSPK